jgi:hypothetical protein
MDEQVTRSHRARPAYRAMDAIAVAKVEQTSPALVGARDSRPERLATNAC